jgi:putative transcriptional regulator
MSSLAGKFLVARPSLLDPNFRQTAVLLLQHDSNGAFGLVVNRPTEVEGVPFPILLGGPCPLQGMLMLHGHADWIDADDESPGRRVAPGIFLGDASCMERISDPPEGQSLRFRMFTGYAGWGPNQLEGELSAGAWSVAPASAELLFDTPVEQIWRTLSPSTTIPEPSVN